MRRIDFENKNVKAEPEVPARGPVPFFITLIKSERQIILDQVEVLKDSKKPKKEIKHISDVLTIAMRANQILTAFYKGRDLESVESGDLRNIHFLRAATVAQNFMRSGVAENVHVVAYEKWYRDNLFNMGYGKYMVNTRNIVFPVR